MKSVFVKAIPFSVFMMLGWLPEYEVQRAFFKGEKTYSVDVKF